jgi:hypothetical protein
MCIILNKIRRVSIIMPKAFLFGIKIENKVCKIRNLLTAKSVITAVGTEDENGRQRRW